MHTGATVLQGEQQCDHSSVLLNAQHGKKSKYMSRIMVIVADNHAGLGHCTVFRGACHVLGTLQRLLMYPRTHELNPYLCVCCPLAISSAWYLLPTSLSPVLLTLALALLGSVGFVSPSLARHLGVHHASAAQLAKDERAASEQWPCCCACASPSAAALQALAAGI
jgi:hypothetical protein